MNHSMDWPYLTLGADGKLYDDDGDLAGSFPTFPNASAAEAYLEENDIRGTVRANLGASSTPAHRATVLE
jgi:hypothetical protein